MKKIIWILLCTAMVNLTACAEDAPNCGTGQTQVTLKDGTKACAASGGVRG